MRLRTIALLSWLPIAALAQGAGGRRGPPPHGAMARCPMALEGTQVKEQDVPGGAALDFTTTGDIEELRRRVHHMPAMHEKMKPGHHGMMPGMGEAHAGPAMRQSTVHVENLRNGARLILTPHSQAQLETLRSEVRDHAQAMASGKCPMMGGADGGT